jgi:small-conductance mechanosensitive channel
LDRVTDWLHFTLFRLGETPVTAELLIRLLVLTIGLFWLSGWFRRWLVQRALARFGHLDVGTREAIGSVFRYAVLVMGLALILQNAGIRLTALGVVAGALGVGVGFGLQNIISNFVSGMIIMLERPIKVGDPIELGNVSGVVREIGARRTTIVTPDHIAVLVPNQRFVVDNVLNMAYFGKPVRLRLPVPLPADADLPALQARLLAVARSQPQVLADPPPALLVTTLTASSATLELAVWHDPYEASRQDLAAALNGEIARVIHQAPEAPEALGTPTEPGPERPEPMPPAAR